MDCDCQQLPETFFVNEGPSSFLNLLEEIEEGEWKHLFICRSCKSLWIVDDWDKFTDRVAVRIQERENWNLKDTTEQRKGLLLLSRGGIGTEPCIWAGCYALRVKGVVFCVEHLWRTGSRR